jgi:ankyrin repeat protein
LACFLQKNINDYYPLHCVIESRCIENLKEVESLFAYTNPNADELDTEHKMRFSPYVNVKNERGQNVLHVLCEQLSNDSYDVIFPLVKILLAHGCNANFPNDDQKTPFFLVLEKLPELKSRKEIAEYFIKHGDLDFYSYRSEELVDLLMNQKVKYLPALPEQDDFVNSYQSMLQLLRNGEINKFETKFFHFKATCADTEEYNERLSHFLEIAVENSLINIVDLLISYGADINRVSKVSKHKMPPTFIAYKNADYGIFNSFMLRPEIKLYYSDSPESPRKTLLHLFFDEFKTQTYASFKKCNFSRHLTHDQKKCFDLIMQSKKCTRELVNSKDENNLTTIYYAVKFKIDYCTIELLKNGAYIDKVIGKGGIRKSLLTNFLDSCITTRGVHDDEDYEININYGFLMPYSHVISCRKFRKLGTNLQLPISQKTPEEFSTLMEESETKYAEEMKPLQKIAQSEELQHFLLHPVISSFVLLKWNKLNFLIYINLLLILMYMFSFIPFAVLCQTIPVDERAASFAYNFFYILSFISLSFIIIRESMQFFLSVSQYLQSRSNWIDIFLIVSSIVILFFEEQVPNHISRMLRTIIILLATIEYFNLLGLLPLLSVSLHTKMFKKVCTTFVKSLAFYSVLILAFAFSFYTLQGDKFAKDLVKLAHEGRDNTTNDIPVTNATRNERFNNFNTIGLSIIKSFVMLTGELETSYVHLEGTTYAALFLLFLFLVTIVLYNLLNALAVSDTQEIKSDAKLIDLQQRIVTMHESEEAVFRRNSRMGDWFKKVISMFPRTIPDGSVTIRINRSYQLYVRQTEPIILNDWLPNNFKFLKKNVKINSETALDIRKLLAKKREERTINAVRKLKENRNEKLANDIIKMNEMISDIQKNIVQLQSDLFSIKKRINL